METEDIILLGAIGVAAYFLIKPFSKAISDTGAIAGDVTGAIRGAEQLPSNAYNYLFGFGQPSGLSQDVFGWLQSMFNTGATSGTTYTPPPTVWTNPQTQNTTTPTTTTTTTQAPSTWKQYSEQHIINRPKPTIPTTFYYQTPTLTIKQAAAQQQAQNILQKIKIFGYS